MSISGSFFYDRERLTQCYLYKLISLEIVIWFHSHRRPRCFLWNVHWYLLPIFFISCHKFKFLPKTDFQQIRVWILARLSFHCHTTLIEEACTRHHSPDMNAYIYRLDKIILKQYTDNRNQLLFHSENIVLVEQLCFMCF